MIASQAVEPSTILEPDSSIVMVTGGLPDTPRGGFSKFMHNEQVLCEVTKRFTEPFFKFWKPATISIQIGTHMYQVQQDKRWHKNTRYVVRQTDEQIAVLGTRGLEDFTYQNRGYRLRGSLGNPTPFSGAVLVDDQKQTLLSLQKEARLLPNFQDFASKPVSWKVEQPFTLELLGVALVIIHEDPNQYSDSGP